MCGYIYMDHFLLLTCSLRCFVYSFRLQSRCSVNTWLACYKFFHGRSNWQASFTMIQVMSASTIQTLKQAPLQPKVNTQLCIAKHHFHRHLHAEGLPMWWTVLPSISFCSNVPNINFYTPRSKKKNNKHIYVPWVPAHLAHVDQCMMNRLVLQHFASGFGPKFCILGQWCQPRHGKKRVQKPLTSQVSPRFKYIYICIYIYILFFFLSLVSPTFTAILWDPFSQSHL